MPLGYFLTCLDILDAGVPPKKVFLIVDDFSDFRSSIRSMLRELGVKDVDTADTGEVALRMCSQKRYDFILQDYHLGDGRKNGQQVLEDLMVEKKLISHESVFPHGDRRDQPGDGAQCPGA
nr:hypothetical protein GCM10020185_54650 [Pseudomonas brassicacearum subsp. brassicacearum]